MNITPNVTLEAATFSATAKRKGIKNIPTEDQIARMRELAVGIIEPLLHTFGKVKWNSMFRSEQLNKSVGGSSTSQHCKGEAVDLVSDEPGKTNKDLFDHIRKNDDFDQLINEFPVNGIPSWVHVSFVIEGNRKQVLQSIHKNGKTIYIRL